MLGSGSRQEEDSLARYGLDASAWEALRAIIRERSFSEGGAMTLASEQQSSFYFDMRRTLSLPRALNHAADLLLPILYDGPCGYIGGLEMGAIPVLNAVAMRSAMPPHEKPLPLFWVRKQAKEHGTRRRIEGQDIADLQGRTAVMLEDVTTTGNSVLTAIREARETGLEVSRVITLVDRLEGAEENLAAAGVDLIALYNAGHFRG
jgi:orotate phosphoribosyltransferase